MFSVKKNKPAGMRAFIIVWLGQLVSLFGTSLSRFALTIWAWELTGEATALALVGLFSFAPGIFLSPIAGALVDRWNRKFVMMISDLAAGVSTIIVFILFSTDSLELWHLYVAGAFASAFESFQFPAYSASISTMLPKEQYARANGMLAMAHSAAQIFAPALAATLLAIVGVGGVLMIDIVTFTVAVSALAFVFIPQPTETSEGKAGQGNILRESAYGFKYIWARPSLLGLQMMFFILNLFGTISFVLIAPMILSRTSNNELILGSVQSVGAIGGLLGGLAISIWGGPKRLVHGVLGGMVVTGFLGIVPLGLGREIIVWSIASFIMYFAIQVLDASNQAIWQAKVAPDVQGRVFAVRRLIAQITVPLAMLVTGPLADRVFESAMTSDGAMADLFGGLVGTEAGSGMALIIVITGIISGVAAIGGYAFPFIRNAEDIIPDHTQDITSKDTVFDESDDNELAPA